MKNTMAFNYSGIIKSILPPDEFKPIESTIRKASNEELEAFWNIIVAGYSIEFALENYQNLYNYLKDRPIHYYEALITYVIYPGLKSGIYITKTKWFELN